MLPVSSGTTQGLMKLGFTWYALAILLLALLLGVAHAQQSAPPNPEHPGQQQQSASYTMILLSKRCRTVQSICWSTSQADITRDRFA